MIKTGIKKVKVVRVLGGPTKSNIWNQIQADIHNSDVETVKVKDAAVLGAAILSGVGTNIFYDINDGVKRMVKIDKVFKPIKENVDLYKNLYEIYCDIYEGLENKNVYESIAKIQKKY